MKTFSELIKLAATKLTPPVVFTKKHHAHIDKIKSAANSAQMVTINYVDRKGNASTRTVEPYKMDGNDFWGYDPEKNNIRRFKVTQIQSVTKTKQTYEPRWDIEMQNAGIVPSVIKFPKGEHNSLLDLIKHGNPIYTTRVSKEYDKYHVGDVLQGDIGHKLKVVDVTRLKRIDDHPFKNELSKAQVKQLSKYQDMDLVKLEKTASLNYHRIEKIRYRHMPTMKVNGKLVRIESSLKKAVR